MDSLIFGNKEIFAIELKDYNPQKKSGRIRLWLNEKQFGDLKTKDDLRDAIRSFKVLITKKEELYEDSFDSMSKEEIFSYCLLLNVDFNEFSEENYALVNKMRESFSLWFGEQLDNVSHVIYFKEGWYHFLWSYNAYNTRKLEFLNNLDYTKVPEKDVLEGVLSFLTAVE